jgi:hypothetical protein
MASVEALIKEIKKIGETLALPFIMELCIHPQ